MEFDEPLYYIIEGMREQGCTWKTIAGVLEIHEHTLVKWRRKLGFEIKGVEDRNYEESRGGKSPIEDIAKRHGYAGFGELYRDLRMTHKMTVKEVAETIGVSPRTVQKWTPPELKGLWRSTAKNRESAIQNLKKARENNQTPWKDGLNIYDAKPNESLYRGGSNGHGLRSGKAD